MDLRDFMDARNQDKVKDALDSIQLLFDHKTKENKELRRELNKTEDELERIELNPKEEKRTYNFPNGDKLEFENVVAIFKNTGATSRIETVDMYGETFIHIIKNDWISIDIKADKFTV